MLTGAVSQSSNMRKKSLAPNAFGKRDSLSELVADSSGKASKALTGEGKDVHHVLAVTGALLLLCRRRRRPVRGAKRFLTSCGVAVHRGKDLPAMDASGFSDPYCVLQLSGSKQLEETCVFRPPIAARDRLTRVCVACAASASSRRSIRCGKTRLSWTCCTMGRC